MIIRSVEFVTSVADPATPPPSDLPQIAFSGRSNVGKSSLINTMLGRTRTRVAHVSATPGKTQTLNFFRVNDAFLLVDLPGYGYAKVPRTQREGWAALIDGYLRAKWAPRGVVQLIDIRHDPTQDDLAMIERLGALGLPTLIVLTKSDKVGKERRAQATAEVAARLGVDPGQVLPFSARTGEGKEALLEAVEALLDGGESA